MRVEDWEREIGRGTWTGDRTTTCAGITYAVAPRRIAWTSGQGTTVAVNVVINATAGWHVFEMTIGGRVIEATDDTSVIRNERVREAMETALGCAIAAVREWLTPPKQSTPKPKPTVKPKATPRARHKPEPPAATGED